MKARDSLTFEPKSAIQIWLGMLLASDGQQKERLSDEAVPEAHSKVSPTPREFHIVKEDSKNKCISSADGAASFCLHKVSVPTQQHNQYEWDFSDSQGDFAEGVVLKHGGSHFLATLKRKDGSVLAHLHHGGFHTLNKFRWGSKTYRWTTAGCVESKSTMQIRLVEDGGSRQELARFSGAGAKCKSYWIQNPELGEDTITMFGRTDYPIWMQIVITSGMVAAKTQRRIDKGFQGSYY